MRVPNDPGARDPVNPLYHPAVVPTPETDEVRERSERLASRRPRLSPGRYSQWVAATPEERARLEEQWAQEDADALEQQKKADEEARARADKIKEARQNLRGRAKTDRLPTADTTNANGGSGAVGPIAK